MIGIIYKFTILARYKMDGHKPFYVGQHVGVNDFNNYWGSGSIWIDFLNRLKKDYPNHWRKFIRREILYIHNCSQKTLDILEEYYIKKEQSHYSYQKGGCNVLWGAAIDNNPMKELLVREKVRKANLGKHHSEETKRKIANKQMGVNNWHFGKHWSDKVKKKISDANRGKKRSEITKSKLRKFTGERNSRFGKKCSEEHKEKLRQSNIGKHNKGLVFVSNGIVQFKINIYEQEIPHGFKRSTIKSYNKYYKK
jgi:hypothetical protein